MPYAIVVNVPEAKDECFIAMPFADRFEGLFTQIALAATQVKLRPVRIKTGETQPGVDFDKDVVDATRAARFVVAVCSPEEATGKPNPNVMYELGWAHALGKPTLILTSDIKTLPSDLAVKHVLAYEESEVGTTGLSLKIREQMRDVLGRMAKDNPLTDPAYKEIYVARERHLMFHNPIFWDNFRTILSFAKLTHDEHQQIDTAVVDRLLSEANEMYANPGQAQRVTALLKAWRDYDDYYQSRTCPNVYENVQEKFERVDTAFDFLKAEAGPELRRHVNDCYGFYRKVRDLLTSYPGEYQRLAAHVENDALPRQQDSELINNVFFQARRVSKDTKTIVMNSDRLIVNLIEMIRRTGD